jgi:precorrin-6B methylase 2
MTTPRNHRSDIDTLRHAVGEVGRATVLLTALGLALKARITGMPLDPAIAEATATLLALQGLTQAVAGANPEELPPVLALIRAEMLFGGHILGPGIGQRGWQDRDPEVMQVFGEVSHGFWRGLERLATRDAPKLLDRLDQPGARFLDIGTGVGWLSIGMLQRWANLTAVGIEPLPGALAQARSNLEETGLSDRMELRQGLGEGLADRAAFDLVFVPSAFIPASALPDILARGRAALRPGGSLLLAVLQPPDHESAAALVRLRAAVWGGDVIGTTGGTSLMQAAGFRSIKAMQQPGGFIAFLLATLEDIGAT